MISHTSPGSAGCDGNATRDKAETASFPLLIQNGTEIICTAIWVVNLPLSPLISSQWVTFHKRLYFIQEEIEKKALFFFNLLFFALLSSTVLKTKLILDLTNLPFNMTMQSISFYLDFAFYKCFILSFVQSPCHTFATLSFFFSDTFCPEAKIFSK